MSAVTENAYVSPNPRTVVVTGGAGYVGSCLVPKLLAAGHSVTVLDLFLFGYSSFGQAQQYSNLRLLRGDIRSAESVQRALTGADSVIHLACISNDPSFELDPDLGRSINYDCFRPMVRMAKDAGVNRFIYASSSSVYGIKDEAEVTEELALEPLTDYSKYKALCEDVLEAERAPGFTTLALRPATVCGYAPRLRLDLTVNILTNHAINNRKINVFGGGQTRPNINIEDMTDLYVRALDYDDALIDGGIFNAGYENHTVQDLAGMVRDVVGDDVGIATTPSDDHRSYRVCSRKIQEQLGFTPRYSIEDAIDGLVDAFRRDEIPNPLSDDRYYNVKRMQTLELQ